MENRPAERELLMSRAEQALEDPASLEPREPLGAARPLLRLRHYPAFFAWTVWMVFQRDKDGHELLVRRVNWDHPHDFRRFSDPLEGVRQGFFAPPTLVVHDARTTDRALRPYLRELRKLSIPPLGIDASIGIDGETFGLQTYGASDSTRLEWWCEGPREWRPFTEAAGRLRNFLDGLFEEPYEGGELMT